MSIWVQKNKVLHTSNIFVGMLVKWRATYILPSTLSIKTVSKIVWSTWLTTQQSEPKEYLSSSVRKQVIIIVVQVLVVHRKALRVLLWNETVWSRYQCVTRLHSHDSLTHRAWGEQGYNASRAENRDVIACACVHVSATVDMVCFLTAAWYQCYEVCIRIIFYPYNMCVL